MFLSAFIKMFASLLAFLVFLLIIIIIVSSLSYFNDPSSFINHIGNKDNKNKIALIELNGPIISKPSNLYPFTNITQNEVIYPFKIKKIFEKLKKENVKGVVISINSPGGSVSSTNEIYEIINKFKTDYSIPIYFHTTDILASGGYWIALSGDKIFSSYGSLIGSIGVKGPDWIYYNNPTQISSGILGSSVESKNGIKLFSSIAGKNKDLLNPFREPSKSELMQLQKMINNIYTDFVNKVSMSRKIEKDIIVNDIGAMIFDAKEAKQKFLINEVQNIEATLESIASDLRLNDFQIIISKSNKRLNLNTLDLLNKIINNNFLENNINKINNHVCNNLKYEISSIIENRYQSKCER